jgi:hypothetical protein
MMVLPNPGPDHPLLLEQEHRRGDRTEDGGSMSDDTVIQFPSQGRPLGVPARQGNVESDLDARNPFRDSLRGLLTHRRELVQAYGWGDGSVREIERAIADRLAVLAGDEPIENPA